MKKATLLFWVNLVLLLSFLFQAGTGLFHEAIPYRIFREIHEHNGLLLVILGICHLILNWSWIKTNFISRFV